MYWWIAENTLIAAVLALFVALGCRAFRAAPVIRHALWLVVLIRLIAPPIFSISLPFHAKWDSLNDGHGTVEATDARAVPDAPRATSLSEDSVPVPCSEPTAEEGFAAAVSDEPAIFSPTVDRDGQSFADTRPAEDGILGSAILDDNPPSLQKIANGSENSIDERAAIGGRAGTMFLVWGGLAGTMIVVGLQVVRIVRMFRLLERSQPASAELVAMVNDAAARMTLRAPQVRQSPDLQSPVICALGRAVLLWPESTVDEIPVTGRQAIVVHELAHLARGDHFVGWLELVAGCLWWWNPLFWYVRHQLRENAELACDAWAVGLFPEARRDYAQALVDLAELDSLRSVLAPEFGAGALGVGEGSRNLFERRLVMIMGERVRFRLGAGGFIGIGLLALVVLPGCSYGQAGDEPIDVGSAKIATVARDAEDRPLVGAAVASEPELGDPFAPAREAGPQTGQASGVPAPAPIQNTEPAVGLPASPPFDDAFEVPKPILPSSTAAANPPSNSNEDRIQRLEGQLEAILAELRELKHPEKGNVPASDWAPLPSLTKVPGKAMFTTSPQKPNSTATPVDGLVSRPEMSAGSSKLPRTDGEVESVSLTRVTYRIPPGKAQAVAAFLAENLNDEIEVRVKDDSLQVTARSEDQEKISQFVRLLQTRAAAAPKPAAPRSDPLRGTTSDDGFDLRNPAKPGQPPLFDDTPVPVELPKRSSVP